MVDSKDGDAVRNDTSTVEPGLVGTNMWAPSGQADRGVSGMSHQEETPRKTRTHCRDYMLAWEHLGSRWRR